jgi:ribonuclease P protein component
MSEYSFPRLERLKSKKKISQVFAEGKSVFRTILSVRLLKETGIQTDAVVKVAFSVPKRKVQSAVKRNLIKRRMKEAYRLNRSMIPMDDIANAGQFYSVVFIYQSNEIQSYVEIEKYMTKIMWKIFN